MASSNPITKLNREDWKKQKELEEARKAGTAPAEVDEEGKDINPHIPQYIREAPWYVSTGRPTLKHQRVPGEMIKTYAGMKDWYTRGMKAGPAVAKFRKGACENCGALTHKKKDCMERPRKIGARYTGSDIARDEVIQPDIDLDFAGKRDRWNGYDPEEYQQIVNEHAQMELAKKQLKSDQLKQEFTETVDEEDAETEKKNDSDLEEDEDKYAHEEAMPGTKFDTKQRMTVRNLRIREDTAKYLYNLDVNGPYYDPKTRSMRENPFKEMGLSATEVKYAGDNFVRNSGDTVRMAQAQVFAWDAYDRGTSVHLQAEPTKLELLQKNFSVKKDKFKNELQDSILSKYGGEEHLDAPPKELLMAQTENYVEYSRFGDIIKGEEKVIAKSKYEEDVYINNHTSIWGSYWESGSWGYVCCYSLVKNSYCVGKDGAGEAKVSVVDLLTSNPFTNDKEPDTSRPLIEQHQEKRKEKKKMKKKRKDKDKEESESREDRLARALKAEEERIKEVDGMLAVDERKRKYNSLKEMQSMQAPTEEEIEAFQIKRKRPDDPMAQFLTNN
ncbi:pre-mRNA-splicing factor SLU7-like [Corticium candelabrum]|uniref:pre-mRNA-splicing factor SLU7-like n=1 Tax=Corticium candelabrum TaxID=121492 RepID=UPI002E2696D4|nr:pre-mRNA-splicing factor SLU7-like [Corticium candelabrum]